METATENEIKGRFSPQELFSIGQAAHAEGYREMTSYIRDTMLKRVYEVNSKEREQNLTPTPATTNETH